ncbi:MAG: NUDIX hydrolase [Alphaproteobacteria bacterium]
MHREPVLRLLEDYQDRHPAEAAVVARTSELVRARPDCFDRGCLPGHLTGSAWIVSADFRDVLLTHHRKLGRWLQLGGHADGDPDLLRVALREAREESGLDRFEPWAGAAGIVQLLDLDIHPIPAHGGEPGHDHHDLRFLLVAAPGQELRISEESNDLRWVRREDLRALADEESILRMASKAAALLERP